MKILKSSKCIFTFILLLFLSFPFVSSAKELKTQKKILDSNSSTGVVLKQILADTDEIFLNYLSEESLETLLAYVKKIPTITQNFSDNEIKFVLSFYKENSSSIRQFIRDNRVSMLKKLDDESLIGFIYDYSLLNLDKVVRFAYSNQKGIPVRLIKGNREEFYFMLKYAFRNLDSVVIFVQDNRNKVKKNILSGNYIGIFIDYLVSHPEEAVDYMIKYKNEMPKTFVVLLKNHKNEISEKTIKYMKKYKSVIPKDLLPLLDSADGIIKKSSKTADGILDFGLDIMNDVLK